MSITARMAALSLAVATIVLPFATPAFSAASPPCEGIPATPGGAGTNASETLRGDGNVDKRDIMQGLGGVDEILGKTGDDWLCGGSGNDILDGEPGYDICIGGAGNDSYTRCEALHP